jgi:hypothetical protein
LLHVFADVAADIFLCLVNDFDFVNLGTFFWRVLPSSLSFWTAVCSMPFLLADKAPPFSPEFGLFRILDAG